MNFISRLVGTVCSVMHQPFIGKRISQKSASCCAMHVTFEVRLRESRRRPDVTHCIPHIMFMFNSCQGLTLDSVVIDGRTNVTHLLRALSASLLDGWGFVCWETVDPENLKGRLTVIEGEMMAH